MMFRMQYSFSIKACIVAETKKRQKSELLSVCSQNQNINIEIQSKQKEQQQQHYACTYRRIHLPSKQHTHQRRDVQIPETNAEIFEVIIEPKRRIIEGK